MSSDLSTAVAELATGRGSAAQHLERARGRLAGCQRAFIRTSSTPRARPRATPMPSPRAGRPLPLAGLAVCIKDLFDVHGAPTTAGSRSLALRRPPSATAPAVARLRAAGAALIGHTNLTEFAFSGVGINPHFGTPAQPRRARSSSAAHPRRLDVGRRGRRSRPAPPGPRSVPTPAARSAFPPRCWPGRLQEHASLTPPRADSAVAFARHVLRHHALGARRGAAA